MPFDPSSAKLFEPESARLVEEEPEATTLDKLKGLGEVALSLGTGAIGGGLGAASGTIAGLRKYGFNNPKAVEEEAARQAAELTYVPRTKQGAEYMEPVGEFVNRYVVPAAPFMADIEGAAMASKAARRLKAQTAKQEIHPVAPEAPASLADIVAQAEKAPENQRVGPPTRSTFDPTTAKIFEEAPAAGTKNLRQMELPLGNQPEQITVSPSGTALTTPEQVAGYEAYGRRMEQPEAPPQAPLQGQGELFPNEQVSTIASPYNAAERGVLGEPTPNAALARRQMELQLADEGTLYGTPEGLSRELPGTSRVVEEQAMLDFAQKQAEAKQRELIAKQAVENGETGNLFADYVNQHRPYELFRDENGKPLSRDAFNETIKNLEKEPSAMYVRPEDMDQAYKKYLENFNGVQAGLFDQPTTALEMAQTLKNDAALRMRDNHPLVKAAEKFLNQEQQFLDQLKQQGANAEAIADAARDVAAATERLAKTQENVAKGLATGKPVQAIRRRGGLKGKQQGGATTTEFLESVLSLGLNNKFSKKVLSKQRPEIVAGENRNQHLPQAVRKGLEDYTFERRSNEAIEADIVQNNIPDIGKSVLDKAQAGGLFKQLQTNNPIVRKTFAAVKEAHRNATANIRTFIQDPKEGLPALFRQLTKKEAGNWWAARQIAEGKEKLSPYQMEQMGMNEKQIAMNKRFDQVMDFVFDQINKTRELAGKGPVDKRIGYLAGQFTGDFSRTIYKLDENGNKVIVGRVGSDVKAVMEKRVKAVLEANPEWKADNVRVARKGRRESRQKAFEDAVEMLAENNPDTKALMDVYDRILKDDAYNYMNAKKHTMQKTGIFGSEGMKRDVDAWTNAKEGMASQIRYVEKMLNWAEMSKAVHEVKPLLTNEKINMPNAKAWSSDYIDRALGIQTSGIGHAIDGVIGEVGKAFGIGPSAIESGTGALKSLATKKLLGFGNPAFLAMQILQPMAVSPVLTSLLKSRGLEANLGIMTRGAMSFADIILGKGKTAFDKEIFKEGHARNIFGSEIFEHHGALTKGGKLWQNVSEIGIPQVEGATRGTVFTSVAKVLKENGYSGTKLFDIAENLTNQFMVDYSHVEAPSMYKELGAVGDMAVSLQRYKHSSLSTLAMLAREAKNNKQYRPLMTAITTQIAMGGLTGSLLFNEADWIYKKITGLMGKPDTLTRLVLDHTPDVLSHGAVSALTGMDMSKRFGMTLLPDSFTGAFLPGVNALSDPLISGAQALMNPTNETQWERFAKDVVPAGMKGLVEKKFFEKNNLAINPNKLEGTVERTTADKAAKYLGATGLEESKTKARLYQEQLVDKAYMDKRQAITNRVLDDLYQIDPSDTDSMRKYFREGNGAKLKQDFIDAEGNIDNLVKAVEKFRIAGKTTAMQRKQLAIESANPKQALRYKEMTQHE